MLQPPPVSAQKPVNMPGSSAPSAKFSQIDWNSREHGPHGGSMPRTTHPSVGFRATLCPSLMPSTALPTSATTLQFSCPMVNGKEANGWVVGLSWSMTSPRSLPQNPERTDLSFNHSGPRSSGSGTSRSETQDLGP